MTSDEELLATWRQGDRKAGERLFNRYYVPIGRFFANKAPEDGDDLIQETFMACLQARDQIRNGGGFRPYLFAVATNVLRMHFRRRLRCGPWEPIDEARSLDLAPGPSTIIHNAEEQGVLLEALQRLPLRQQVALELRYWERMTTEDIGCVLDLPVGTVRSHLHRGRRQLEKLLLTMPLAERVRRSTLGDLDGWADSLREVVTRNCA
ncbi:MAG: sigma-70 family RNA polymerase sigma factor [Nannocystaceae bacterium]